MEPEKAVLAVIVLAFFTGYFAGAEGPGIELF